MSFDLVDKLATAGLSVSSVLLYIFYNRYKNRQVSANQVKSAVDVTIGPDLKQRLESIKDNKIAYAKVEGTVKPVGDTVFSYHNKDTEGVLIHSLLEEHKSKRVNGFWSDTKRIIRDVIESVPFYLSTPSNEEIHVTGSSEAEHLMDDLTATYDNFTSNKSSILETGLDRIFGEVSKGIHEKEKMLLVGTHLIGFGELFLENGKIKLGPGEGTKYILTKLSRKEVIKKLESQRYLFKVLMLISGLISTTCLVYLVWKFSKRYFERQRDRTAFREATQGRENVERNGVMNECIICLTNPRDVIMLECGHVALCSQCAANLTDRKCPVCRGHILKFVPLYQS